jgi:hypothetical protein
MSALVLIVLIRLCIAAFAALFLGICITEFTRAFRAEPRLEDLHRIAAHRMHALNQAASRRGGIVAPSSMAALPPH